MAKGIDVVQEDEQLVFGDLKADGYEICYRRVPDDVSGAIIKRHTTYHRKRGEKTEWREVGKEILEFMILGWKGVHKTVAGVRSELEFSTENIAVLPSDITGDLIDLSGVDSLSSQEEDRKNSKPTSGSSTSMKV